MAANSAIEWTDHTFNPWRGCTKVHAGCTNCYAEVNYSVKMHGVKWGPNGTRVKLSDAGWREPLKWNREAEADGQRRRVFCASLADVFEDWQGDIIDSHGRQLWECCNCDFISPYDPLKTLKSQGLDFCCECTAGPDFVPVGMNSLRARLFKLIDATPMLDWLLLTKLPENIRRMWPFRNNIGPPQRSTTAEQFASALHRENVWLGTSISDQKTADEWVPRLLEVRDLAPVLFLSCEPLLGPIEFDPAWTLGITNIPAKESLKSDLPSWAAVTSMDGLPKVDWVIVGGESGPHARECNVVWVRSIVEQCKAAGVPVFVKQLGSKPIEHVQEDMAKVLFPGGVPAGAVCAGQYEHLRTFRFADTKGGDIAEWPEDLRVREFPKEQVHA